MTIQKYNNYVFQSSSTKTKEFLSFARAYKKAIQEKLGADFELVNWNTGHFYISTFVLNKINGKYVYLSCSDVRYFRNAWIDNILVRSAKDAKDYTGGSNNYTKLDSLFSSVSKLSSI